MSLVAVRGHFTKSGILSFPSHVGWVLETYLVTGDFAGFLHLNKMVYLYLFLKTRQTFFAQIVRQNVQGILCIGLFNIMDGDLCNMLVTSQILKSSLLFLESHSSSHQ